MLHEISHITIGLEDIHPPAFYELLDEIKREYATKLAAGEVDADTLDFGCDYTFITTQGQVLTVQAAATTTSHVDAAALTLDDGKDCGAGRRRGRGRGNGNALPLQPWVSRRTRRRKSAGRC